MHNFSFASDFTERINKSQVIDDHLKINVVIHKQKIGLPELKLTYTTITNNGALIYFNSELEGFYNKISHLINTKPDKGIKVRPHSIMYKIQASKLGTPIELRTYKGMQSDTAEGKAWIVNANAIYADIYNQITNYAAPNK